MARVVIENLTKQFKARKKEFTRAVNGLSLAVEDGEFMVLVGPSGCGKSTTLRLIAGLEEPDSGRITIDGRSMERVAPKDRDIAMVFQNHALFPHMTARENLAFGLMVRKYSRAEIASRVGEAADLLGLKDCLDRRPEHLSGGERQRVALGRAIVRKPGVFLFDEPLSNLDAPLRAQLRREISRMHERLSATMIFVTHDQMEAMTMGQRIAVLHQGALQQAAEPLTVYGNPANIFVAGFIGLPKINLLEGTIVREGDGTFFTMTANDAPFVKLRLDEAGAARAAGFTGPKIILGIRAENISTGPATTDKPVSTIEVIAESVETTGADSYLYARRGAQTLVARLQTGGKIRPGEKLALVFDLSAAQLFDPVTDKAMA